MECVEYHAVDYITNPYDGLSSATLLSRTSDLSFTADAEAVSVTSLSSPIQIALPRNDASFDGGEPICSYWDETAGKWATDGCILTGYDENYYYVSAYHLTSFAVLFSGTGGGSDSPVSISIPAFGPGVYSVTEIFGTSNINGEGNLDSSFTQFSLLPPSAFGYGNSEFLSNIYDALNGNDDEFDHTFSILTFAFCMSALLCFFIAIIVLSLPPLRNRLNGSRNRKNRLQSNKRKKMLSGGKQEAVLLTAPTSTVSTNTASSGAPEGEDYWDNE